MKFSTDIVIAFFVFTNIVHHAVASDVTSLRGSFQDDARNLEPLEGICDEVQDDKAQGLCVAFCTKECDTFGHPSCNQLRDNFEKITGQDIFPCDSEAPSLAPSDTPSASPSASPSDRPSASPSASPSDRPSASPSRTPSASPSASPSSSPSSSPTKTPTPVPTSEPTPAPTRPPTPCPCWAESQLNTIDGSNLNTDGDAAQLCYGTDGCNDVFLTGLLYSIRSNSGDFFSARFFFFDDEDPEDPEKTIEVTEYVCDSSRDTFRILTKAEYDLCRGEILDRCPDLFPGFTPVYNV